MMGPSWAVMGAIMGSDGAIRAVMGPSWAVMGAIMGSDGGHHGQ